MPSRFATARSTPTDVILLGPGLGVAQDPALEPARRRIDSLAVPRGLLVLDVDGTLVDDRGILDHLAVGAIDLLTAAGLRVVLATGRSPWSGLAELVRLLGLHGPQITMQGALVIDPGSGEVHLAQGLSATTYLDVLSIADELGLDAVVAVAAGYRVECLPEWTPTAVPARGEGRLLEHVTDLARLADEPAYRVFLPTTAERHDPIRRCLQDRLGARATVTWNDLFGVEVLAPGVDKGSALTWLATSLGIPVQRTAAVGDARNDIGMLLRAGRSAAMGSAPEEVRRAADIVVPPVEEHGVVEALRWFYPDVLADVSRIVEPRGEDWPLVGSSGRVIGL
ncbi:MAG TPA: HAD family hydrolase [Candidatus Limnocylindrales bacterium]|nr:HAD family hydrolase [Candidatus Limnocylindrales bacterium]